MQAVGDRIMSVEFKETVPNVFVGEYYDGHAQKYHCIAVMQSMEQWSVYIDGNPSGSGFGNSEEAQNFALSTLEAQSLHGQRQQRTLMAFAAFAVGGFIFWAAHAGYLNAVSQSLAAVMTSEQSPEPPIAAPITGGTYTAQFPAASPVSKPADSSQLAVKAREMDAEVVAPMPVAALVRPPRDKLPSPPPLLLPYPSRLVVPQNVPDLQLASRPSIQAEKQAIAPAKAKKPRETLDSVKRKKQRAVDALRLRKARKNAAAKKRLDQDKRLARKRAINRLASIKHARTRKANQRRIARQKNTAKRSKLTKRQKISRRAKAAKRNRIEKRRANRRFIRKQQHRRASQRHLTYRQYQMLRNRVIAQRIRDRRRYAR